ncbi:MAG TPA: methyltransferase domain-containing protein [Longimicrobiaceae bacterium]
MNAVFQRWASEGLVWLPERGVGFLRVTEAPYDAEYFAKYERYAETPMGRAITKARLDLVRRHTKTRILCDVGIGCGAFAEAADCCGYDINPVGEAWLRKNGRWLNPYETRVDAVTMWDTLEHIADPAPLLANVRRWVFVSLPIVPGDGPPPLDWKHLRRDEHTLYFTRDGLIRFMDAHGFACVEHSTAESLLGREDIGSFAFKRQ